MDSTIEDIIPPEIKTLRKILRLMHPALPLRNHGLLLLVLTELVAAPGSTAVEIAAKRKTTENAARRLLTALVNYKVAKQITSLTAPKRVRYWATEQGEAQVKKLAEPLRGLPCQPADPANFTYPT